VKEMSEVLKIAITDQKLKNQNTVKYFSASLINSKLKLTRVRIGFGILFVCLDKQKTKLLFIYFIFAFAFYSSIPPQPCLKIVVMSICFLVAQSKNGVNTYTNFKSESFTGQTALGGKVIIFMMMMLIKLISIQLL
jgi:hypothetical protein